MFVVMLAWFTDRLRLLLFLLWFGYYLKFVLLTLICGTLISVSVSEMIYLRLNMSKIGLARDIIDWRCEMSRLIPTRLNG